MSSRRTIRVAEVLRKELSSLIFRSVDLEGMLITISGIETSPDLKQAFIYVSTIDPKANKENILSLLGKHGREWQHYIGKRLQAKFSPHLHFRFDSALERGDRVMEILREIDEKSPALEKEDEE